MIPEKSFLIGKLIDLTRKCNDKLFSEQQCPYQVSNYNIFFLCLFAAQNSEKKERKKSCDRINKVEDTVLKMEDETFLSNINKHDCLLIFTEILL